MQSVKHSIIGFLKAFEQNPLTILINIFIIIRVNNIMRKDAKK